MTRIRSALAAAALMGLAACAHTKPANSPDAKIEKLREDFPAFLIEQLNSKKPQAWPMQVKVVSVDVKPDGSVQLKYTLAFSEKSDDGEATETSLESSAVLKPTDSGWLIVQVVPSMQTLGFETGTVIHP